MGTATAAPARPPPPPPPIILSMGVIVIVMLDDVSKLLHAKLRLGVASSIGEKLSANC